jgi:mannose-6-phosphate isomerase-like protein (cupin superfamily)
MRSMIAASLMLLSAAAASGQAPLPAVDVSAGDVKAFLKQMPRDAVSDLPIRVVNVGGYKVGVFGVLRPKSVPGDAILHETKITEVYQILEGSGMLVTGGTIVDQRRDTAGTHVNVRGSRIEGGVSRHVGPGDTVVIPGRTPHWWSSLDGDLTYIIIRADPEGEMALK